LCSRFPAYAGTVRLVKRWFASHWLLETHVSMEAVELVVSTVFADTRGIRRAPSTREKGFACTMELLRDWHWEDGLSTRLYELDTDATREHPEQSTSRGDQQAAWHIRTTMDPVGTMWTSCGPDAVVARRIQSLASATHDMLAASHVGQLCVKVKGSRLICAR
jgi:U3 small nucleolar RNA-associated protein 22